MLGERVLKNTLELRLYFSPKNIPSRPPFLSPPFTLLWGLSEQWWSFVLSVGLEGAFSCYAVYTPWGYFITWYYYCSGNFLLPAFPATDLGNDFVKINLPKWPFSWWLTQWNGSLQLGWWFISHKKCPYFLSPFLALSHSHKITYTFFSECTVFSTSFLSQSNTAKASCGKW